MMPCRKMLLCMFSLLVAIRLSAPAQAADPSFERNAEYIRNELRIAASGIRALAVAAHPDDEDGATLNFLRRAGAETHICFCTRGEGGQNEIGPETGVRIAALRTKEIEEAAAILGAKPWFLNLPDFGFSKSIEETMGVWNHDVALERLVHVIRQIRPQIVITNHDLNGSDHGHHRTAGKLLVEAFDAAADSKMFPKQIEAGLKPWSISRIYLRTFAAEGAAMTVDVSKRDGLSGLSPSEIGAYALSRHFSQGMLRDLKVGERELRHFKILKARTPEDEKAGSMMEGIKALNENDAHSLTKLAESFDTKTLDEGTMARAIMTDTFSGVNPDSKRHLDNALFAALGIKIEVRCEDEFIVAGETAKISVRVANTGLLAVNLTSISLRGDAKKWTLSEKTFAGRDWKSGATETVELELGALDGAELTHPIEEHLFEHENGDSPVKAVLGFSHPSGRDQYIIYYTVEAPVPLGVAAPYTFTLSPNPLIVFSDSALANEDKEAVHYKLLARCNRKIKEPVYLAAAIGDKPKEGDTGKVLPMTFKGDTAVWQFNKWYGVQDLNTGVTIPTHIWDAKGFYPAPAQVVRRVQIDMPPHMRIALIKGVDEQMHLALKRMQDAGVGKGTFAVDTPTAEDLLTLDLNQYQAIVLDIRTTQQRPEIRKLKEKLRAFMEDGGTVVCMYQKDFDWNDRSKAAARGVGFFRGVGNGGEIAPFPIELSFDRVTREDAPILVLDPQHPLMFRPCRIWQKDFEGWAQERGAYFPKTWAPEYKAILSCNDPGEKPLDGGLLCADVGRGGFIYTSYFLHHQLRIGVPGAYRLLANMLCYSRMKRGE